MKVSLLVPTLNEIDGMKVIMRLIKPEWCDQILILDGGSTDGTVEWARENGYEVHIQRQRGLRHGYVETLPLLTGDVIITFSPDGNSVPESIPALAAKMREGFDMVIASRYLDDASSDDDDIVTAFGNWLFTRTVNALHGGGYTDVMVMLRAFRKDLVYELELDKDEHYALPERLFGTKVSWEPLMSARAARRGYRVGEVAFDEPPRIGGDRKLQVLRWGAAYYFQFIWEVFKSPRIRRR